MFTGLVETVGTVIEAVRTGRSVRLGIEPRPEPFDVAVGGSVSISGVCLTVERIAGRALYFTAVAESLKRSTLEQVRTGDRVNLERALRVGGRLDGHFVLGHVDGVGVIRRDRTVGESIVRTIEPPRELMMYMAEKGSVTIDGISLTIAGRDERTLDVSLIPATIANTTMANSKPGDRVNVECDVLARYIHQLLRGNAAPGDGSAGDTLYAKLMRAGF